MTTLRGTGQLLRLALRRDRVRLSIWVLAVVGLTYFSGTSMGAAFPTQHDVLSYGRSVAGSPALIAMTGPPLGLDTLAGIVLNKVGLTAIIGMSLVAILTVVRHTRTEEEEGRSEMLRATVVGRHAGSAAAMLLVAGLSAVMGVGTTYAIIGAQVPAGSSWLFGAGITALGLVFGAVPLVAAQVFTHGRTALGVSIAVLGVAFVIRAVGDVKASWLVWLSPIGWSQATHVLGDERWWPLLVSLVATVLLVGVSVVLADRRDVGAGLVAPRNGSPTASPMLSGPVGLAFRLQRGLLAGWALGLFALSAGMGSLSREVGDMARDNPTLEKYLQATGQASLTDTFFSTMLLIMALLACAFAVSSALRLRSEETSGRLEPLLATGLSRTRWLLGTLLVTVGGTVLLLFVSGLGMGLAYGLVVGDASQPWRLAVLTLVYLPAGVTIAGLAVLLVGWLPRATAVAWAALAFCFVLGWLGGLLDPPQWVQQLSPFWHTPAVPVDDVTWTTLTALTLVAVVLGALGLAGFRRRDITAG
ncbi:MAG: ABC transporter permease [Nocardioidaceae bacterium]|nr:ABC transporter permease [Nocardioidaceae bacterium]